MKRLIAGIATLLIAGNAVALAEEPATAGAELHMPYEAAETIDTVKDTVNQQMQAKIALQNYFKRSVKLADGVMQKASFPRHVSFYPVGRVESSQGTLLISQKGRQTAALVFMMDSLADDPVLGGFLLQIPCRKLHRIFLRFMVVCRWQPEISLMPVCCME